MQSLGGNNSLIARVNTVDVSTATEHIKKFADIIGREIGCLPGEYQINVNETVVPVTLEF